MKFFDFASLHISRLSLKVVRISLVKMLVIVLRKGLIVLINDIGVLWLENSLILLSMRSLDFNKIHTSSEKRSHTLLGLCFELRD